MSLLKKSIAIAVLFVGLGITTLTFLNKWHGANSAEAAENKHEIVEIQKEPQFEFGLPIDSFIVIKNEIKPNQFLADILLKHHIPYPTIDKLVKISKPLFDVRHIKAGKDYSIFCSNDSIEKACYFVYQPSATEYIVFDLRDTLNVYKGEKEVQLEEREVSGVITSSLYQTLADVHTSPKVAVELSEIFAWSIDFYRIQKNDWFKVVYDVKIIDGEAIGVGEVKYAVFNHYGEDYYAFNFEQEAQKDYFDENGHSLRKAFLKAPLKFSRISSRYTLNRYHPVQKRNKPHYGTDYAAANGTPIMAVGDGVIIASAYSKYNGNFVKVKHNGTYTTQYLHMSKRKAKVGQRVRQGDVIGYVGSTGLATGPHVCFRFWKNGKQVDHLKEKFPPSKPIKPAYKDSYAKYIDKMKTRLDTIPLKVKKQEEV